VGGGKRGGESLRTASLHRELDRGGGCIIEKNRKGKKDIPLRRAKKGGERKKKVRKFKKEIWAMTNDRTSTKKTWAGITKPLAMQIGKVCKT